jgi:hypothetical protein
MMHADDLSRGIMAVLDRGEVGRIYNCGPEEPTSMLSLVNMIAPRCWHYVREPSRDGSRSHRAGWALLDRLFGAEGSPVDSRRQACSRHRDDGRVDQGAPGDARDGYDFQDQTMNTICPWEPVGIVRRIWVRLSRFVGAEFLDVAAMPNSEAAHHAEATMITFLGTSHAAEHLRDAARDKGIDVTDEPRLADVIFVSQDTITDDQGNRDLRFVRDLVVNAQLYGKPIVITSQVTPGFTRSFNSLNIYHQAETLRIKDAKERAAHPEQLIVGCMHYQGIDMLPAVYRNYLEAFNCPVMMVKYEDAEFAKIAINMMLAAQVDATNRLVVAASEVRCLVVARCGDPATR